MKEILNTKSIRQRLIILFVGSIIITHIILAVSFQLSVKYHFLKQDYQHIQTEVLNIFSNDSTRKITQKIFDYFALNKKYIWVFNDSRLSYKNSEVALPEGSYSLLWGTKNLKQPFDWKIDGDTYRAFSFSTANDGLLVAGLKINDHLSFARGINWMILAVLFVVAAIAIAYGIFSVNHSLKPLKDFADYLSTVSPEHLSIRIPAQQLPVELKHLAHAQNEMLDRLERGFQRLSEFSSDIAHELRTPLSNIMTQTQVTLTKKRSFTEYEEALIANLEELERINKTINDTLYLAKSENALLHREDQQLDLVTEIAEIIEYLSIIGDDKQLNFELNGTGSLHFDKEMFRRMISNLLSNAVRHAQIASTIDVNISHSSKLVRISVRNTGDTIPQESIPFIFDRFYRADKSRGHQQSVGAGLGLAIARSIIEAYQGKISVISKQGVTLFTIEIPHS